MPDMSIQDLLSGLPLDALLLGAYLHVALFALLWLLDRRAAAFRRRIAIEEANRRSLATRFDEAVAVLEGRLARLEAQGASRRGRTEQRREAVRSIRGGADPVAAAKRFRLARPELELLMELRNMRRAAASESG